MFFQIIFKNSVRTSQRTQPATITDISLLTPFKKAILVYIKNHTEPINAKRRVTGWKAAGTYGYYVLRYKRLN
jgi:hypothetical protein